MFNRERLLRNYIRESLLSERSISDIGSGLKSALGFGDGKSGPQKWFADFMSRQLDAAGEKLGDYFVDKFENMLPDDVKAKLYAYEKEKKETYSESLVKVITAWIEEWENFIGLKLKSAEKEDIFNFAFDEYSKLLVKDPDVKKAIIVVKNKVDEKFGKSTLSKGNLKFLQQKQQNKEKTTR